MPQKFKGSLRLDWINKDKSLYYEIDENEGKGVRPIWVNKDDIRVAEPRILKYVKSYGDPASKNMLIKGDNLLVLKTLVEIFKGRKGKDKVKCIYIDPPYNTGQAFEQYDDNLQHSEWLTMMRDRLQLLRKILSNEGCIFIQIDHQELAYLKVLMDEIFGRKNYIATIPIQMRHPDRILVGDKDIHDIIEYILFYAKNKHSFNIKKNLRDASDYSKYKLRIIETGKGRSVMMGNKKVRIYSTNEYKIKILKPNKNYSRKENIRSSLMERNSTGRFYKKYLMSRLRGDGWGTLYKVPGIGADKFDHRYIMQPTSNKYKNANYFQGWPINKKESVEVPLAAFIDVSDIMASSEVADEGGVRFPKSKKTEHIIDKLLDWALIKKGDLVLDSFAGSGTTAAVAHKRECRWINVELGKHAQTIAFKRLQNVIDNKDKLGVSERHDWSGGDGFKYYQLGDSVINEKDMNWSLEAEEMAEAVFLHFQYKLIQSEFFKNEKIFLGKNRTSHYNYAICYATRKSLMVSEGQYNRIIKYLDENKKFRHLTIFTNLPLAVAPESLDERVLVEKIPAKILREYKLI